jgi:hypothetical protein
MDRLFRAIDAKHWLIGRNDQIEIVRKTHSFKFIKIFSNHAFNVNFIQQRKLFVHTGNSDVTMVTNAWTDIIYVMDGINALMVVMNGIRTVVCIHFTVKSLSYLN